MIPQAQTGRQVIAVWVSVVVIVVTASQLISLTSLSTGMAMVLSFFVGVGFGALGQLACTDYLIRKIRSTR